VLTDFLKHRHDQYRQLDDGDLLPLNGVDKVTVRAGQKISVAAAGSDGSIVTANGTMYITELS